MDIRTAGHCQKEVQVSLGRASGTVLSATSGCPSDVDMTSQRTECPGMGRTDADVRIAAGATRQGLVAEYRCEVLAFEAQCCAEVRASVTHQWSHEHSSCKCEDSSGSIRISPKGPGGGQVTDSESMVVNWAVKFTGKHCITTPCAAVIALAQTDRKGGSPGRPVLVPPGTFDPIETPTNPPCPKFP